MCSLHIRTYFCRSPVPVPAAAAFLRKVLKARLVLSFLEAMTLAFRLLHYSKTR